MVVAENRLSTELVQAGLNTHATDWPQSMLYYQDARGIQELRSTLAHMVQRTFMKVCLLNTGSSASTVNSSAEALQGSTQHASTACLTEQGLTAVDCNQFPMVQITK
jgi:hypothetical protein